ncbi:MAG: hypothetical protein ACSHX7_03030, partial [Luteolibacter sp.]
MPLPQKKLVPGILLMLVIAALAVPPLWWESRGVIDETAVENNQAAVNLGQAKWMVAQAYEEMDSVVPQDLGFVLTDLFPEKPGSPDEVWSEAQKTPLNLGQLKSLAKPFYDKLNEISPEWVLSQIQQNHDSSAVLDTHYWQVGAGTSYTEGGYYPWNPDTPVSENYKPANIGQLKAIFSIDFTQDSESALDGIADLWEHAVVTESQKSDGTWTSITEINAGNASQAGTATNSGSPVFSSTGSGGGSSGSPSDDSD